MTREEIINQGRPTEPNCFETDREEQWYNVGLYDGATASPWHSVADGDFPKEDKDICIAVTEYGSIFIVYFVRHANGGIFYNYNEHTNIDIKYWMEIPQLPKESEVSNG